MIGACTKLRSPLYVLCYLQLFYFAVLLHNLLLYFNYVCKENVETFNHNMHKRVTIVHHLIEKVLIVQGIIIV